MHSRIAVSFYLISTRSFLSMLDTSTIYENINNQEMDPLDNKNIYFRSVLGSKFMFPYLQRRISPDWLLNISTS